jgi:C4-dicarboxylate transporter DctM subunit
MIVYGVIANISVSTLFMAGFIPGFLAGVVLMSTAYILARRSGYQGNLQQYTVAEFFQAVKKNIWAMMTPVVILGGIYAGICTPVEASVVAVFYAFFVGAFINKKLNFKEFWESVKLTNMTTATILIVVGVSVLFGRYLTIYQIPQKLAELMLSISSNPYPIMAMIMVLLFFLGMFMETLATIVILTPIFMPVIEKVGIDPVFFGIMWVMNNEVALLSPPLGVNLFVAMNLSGLSLEKVARGALPYMIVMVLLIMFLIAFPDIPLILPRMFGGYTG